MLVVVRFGHQMQVLIPPCRITILSSHALTSILAQSLISRGKLSDLSQFCFCRETYMRSFTEFLGT